MTRYREAELRTVIARARGRISAAAGLDPAGRALAATAADALADLAEHLQAGERERPGA